MIPDAVRAAAQKHKYPLLFATVSGAHLYGFPSADSDWDLRGAHVLPARQVVGLLPLEETIESSTDEGIEIDLVTHDIRKFLLLLLRPNGYVLEQLMSPIVVHTTPEHEELVALAPTCLTRRHARHYLGFAESQWKLFRKDEPPRVKPLLYVFRVLLTGIHLMQSGEIEANLVTLNKTFRLPYLADLLALKIEGSEHETLSGSETDFYERECQALRSRLMSAMESTKLPETPSAAPALNDLLVRVRLKTAFR